MSNVLPLHSRPTPSAIYLFGHGPYREPRVLDLFLHRPHRMARMALG